MKINVKVEFRQVDAFAKVIRLFRTFIARSAIHE